MPSSQVHTQDGKLVQTSAGQPVDESWLAQQAVKLLELAQEAEEVDHAACVKYLDLLAKVLLPKSGAASGVAAGNALLEQAREAAKIELKKKLG